MGFHGRWLISARSISFWRKGRGLDDQVGALAAAIGQDKLGVEPVAVFGQVAGGGFIGGEAAHEMARGDAAHGDVERTIEENAEVEKLLHPPCTQQQIKPFDKYGRRARPDFDRAFARSPSA